MFQNHLLQLARADRDGAAGRLHGRRGARREGEGAARRCTRPGAEVDVVRGQYGARRRRGRARCPATARSRASRPDSMTETYVAAKLYIDNWRWAGVPFYLRTGKRLPQRETTIAIQFKRAPHPLVREDDVGDGAAAERARSSTSSPTRASRSRSAPRCPGQGMTIRTGAHGLPLRRRLPHRAARGLRAADPRLRCSATRRCSRAPTRSRSSGSSSTSIVAAWQRDRPAFPNYDAGTWGPAARRRAAPPRRPLLAPALSRDRSSVSRRSRSSARLDDAARSATEPSQRTSVLTHMAWVPPEWEPAAERVLEGLGARVPSRTILLHPDPGGEGRPARRRDHARVLFPAASRASARRSSASGCAAAARTRRRASSCRSRFPTCPVFLRWRGQPPFGAREFEQLVGVSDRLIVDSPEWPGPEGRSRALPDLFGQIAVSDIAWARLALAGALAELWPGIPTSARGRVRGTLARRCSSRAGSLAARPRRHRARARAGGGDRASSRRARRRTRAARAAPAERPPLRGARPVHPGPGVRGGGPLCGVVDVGGPDRRGDDRQREHEEHEAETERSCGRARDPC